jgi:release factor glutamine methyltransferase
MLVREALRLGAHEIAAIGSDEAQLESELLLRHVIGLGRDGLYKRLGTELDPGLEQQFRELLQRRLSHEPLPYITGRRVFFGLTLEVTPAVLIPRPETELLVEAVIQYARFREPEITIADTGTGSGAIAVALAVNLPDARIVATDCSAESLEVAGRNAERHALRGRIAFHTGNLLESVGRVDIIAANPPYVTTAEWEAMPTEIREHEPRLALDGGADGLDVVRPLLAQAPSHLALAGALFCEIGYQQGRAAEVIATQAFPAARVEVRRDLAGRDRILCVFT